MDLIKRAAERQELFVRIVEQHDASAYKDESFWQMVRSSLYDLSLDYEALREIAVMASPTAEDLEYVLEEARFLWNDTTYDLYEIIEGHEHRVLPAIHAVRAKRRSAFTAIESLELAVLAQSPAPSPE